MKRWKRWLALTLLLGVLLLPGCAKKVQSPAPETPDAPAGPPAETAEPAPASRDASLLRALIVDGAETGELVLAGEDGAVYRLDAATVSVTLDDAPADASALADGMTVEIACSGARDALPAQLGAESIAAWSLGTAQNPGGTAYDLCGLYLQVLDDLWARDPGLNGGAEYLSVDLSAAPGELSDAAKQAVAWVFAQKHGAQPLALTSAELAEQGYLTDVSPEGAERPLYEWEDGVLFRIAADEGAAGEQYSLPTVKFTADKWRSPLGAYGFARCTAVWPELGTWSDYSIGGEFIA